VTISKRQHAPMTIAGLKDQCHSEEQALHDDGFAGHYLTDAN
jgi:hypothetical protein